MRLALLLDTSRSLPGQAWASSARFQGVLAPSLKPPPYGLRRVSLREKEVQPVKPPWVQDPHTAAGTSSSDPSEQI